MTKFFIMIIVLFSFNSIAGVTILGTRFIINEETKRLNIKLKNDNEGDFLIKTNVYCKEHDELIISPPLFVLPKNASNIVSIIPSIIEKNGQDHLCKLSVAAIPKSPMSKNSIISLAIRSNFHLIYRHDQLKNARIKKTKTY